MFLGFLLSLLLLDFVLVESGSQLHTPRLWGHVELHLGSMLGGLRPSGSHLDELGLVPCDEVGSHFQRTVASQEVTGQAR